MEESAYFGVYSRRFGVPLIDGGTVRLPRLVGTGRAMEIVLTGRKVPAPEAYLIGACEDVVADGMSRAAAEALAEKIAQFPQASMRADRRSLHMQQGLPVREAMRIEWYNGVPAMLDEGAEGAAHFAAGEGRQADPSDL
jgi:enoyl-CoA hydratase